MRDSVTMVMMMIILYVAEFPIDQLNVKIVGYRQFKQRILLSIIRFNDSQPMKTPTVTDEWMSRLNAVHSHLMLAAEPIFRFTEQ